MKNTRSLETATEVLKELNLKKSTFVGHDAVQKRGVLSLKYPVEHTIITNWDDMLVLWEHMFQNELSVPPDKHPILLTEAPMIPKANREKMVQIMIEYFKTPGLYVAKTAALSLLATGRRTGFVFESGGGSSYAVPVYEGHCLPHAVPKLEVSGRDLTYYMMKLLIECERYSFDHGNAFRLAEDIKESVCYVAPDFEYEMQRPELSVSTTFEEPLNKSLITIGNERFRCPEQLFKPTDYTFGMRGIHEAIILGINKCDEDIRSELFANIVISGGSTLFPGLPERLQKEVAALAPSGTEVKVIAEPDRKIGAWLGGSKLASSPEFRRMLITPDEYEEFGPSLVHKKCF